ncbi:MAG: hypothetical protein QXD94_00170 [Sulfolobales archaeon]
MPKKRKEVEKEGGRGANGGVNGREVSKKSADEKGRSVTKVKKDVDIDSWLEKNVEELVNSLGLDFLSLSKEEYLEILKHPVELLYGSPSSRPDVQTIAKRFRRFSDNVNPFIALALLNIRERLNPEHIDFVVGNIGKAILGVAPRIYKEVVRLGREDTLPLLRRLWRTSWIEQRSKTLPAMCPVCLFNALTKDMHCIVCGSVITEKQLKEFLGFSEMLKNYVRSLTCDELSQLMKYDYVIINGNGIKHPIDLREEVVDIEVLLDSNDKTLIRDSYRELCEDGVSLENT